MVQLFKNVFAFRGVNFHYYSKKFEFLLSICRILRIFTFSLIQEYHFNDHFARLYHFWQRYHTLMFSSTCVNIKADSEQISAESALKTLCIRVQKISAEQRWFRAHFLWNSAEFFSSEQRWFRANQRWISAQNPMYQNSENQRWTALIQSSFSLKQRWIFQLWTALIQSKSELINSETELISADVLHVLWISAQKRQISETELFSADFLWDFNPGTIVETFFVKWRSRKSRVRTLV